MESNFGDPKFDLKESLNELLPCSLSFYSLTSPFNNDHRHEINLSLNWSIGNEHGVLHELNLCPLPLVVCLDYLIIYSAFVANSEENC
jgi:hypothetical protein